MTKQPRRFGRFSARIGRIGSAAAGLLVLAGSLASAGPALAAAADVTISLEQVTGIAPFNTDDTRGHDSTGANDIVRTNDLIDYQVSVGSSDGGSIDNAVITLALPPGQQIFPNTASLPPQYATAAFLAAHTPPVVPSFCLNHTLSPAVIADPPNPITMTSYLSLPAQTLRCEVATIDTSSAMIYTFPAMVRPELPNGLAMGPVTASVNGAGTPPVTSAPVTATVSAASKWNIGINGASPLPNDAFVKQGAVQKCTSPLLAGQICFLGGYPLTISVPDAGRGGVPVVNGAFRFQVDVDPETVYGSVAAGASNTAYGGYLGSMTCDVPNYMTVWPRIGMNGSATAANSARNSGTVSCTQPGGPGTPVIVSTTGMDSSAFTIPTDYLAPAGGKARTDLGYVFSARVWLEWPIAGVTTFGTGTNPTIAPITPRVSGIVETDIDGLPNLDGANVAWDDYRRLPARYANSVAAANHWAGVPGAPTTTPPIIFSPGYPAWTGPSGPAGIDTGDGVATIGQRVLDTVHLQGEVAIGGPGVTSLTCVTVDNTRTALADVPVASGVGPAEQAQGTDRNGQTTPVWISGSMVNFNEIFGTPAFSDRFGLFQVQYSALPPGGGDATRCDGSAGWYSSPNDPALGNDPAQAAAGVYTGVSRIRILVQQKAGTAAAFQRVSVSIGMQVIGGAPGDLLPSWTGYTSTSGLQTMATMTDPSAVWRTSTFDPAVNTPTLANRSGDRLTLVSGLGRLTKTVLDPTTGAYVATDRWTPALRTWEQIGGTPPLFAAGQQVQYRIQPSYIADTAAVVSQHVTVEDCLPVDVKYVSATPAASVVSTTPPASATISCPAGSVYVAWDLGQRTLNQPIPPIDVTVQILETAQNGRRMNTAVIDVVGDISSVDLRTAKASVVYASPDGLRLSKSTTDSVVSVDPSGWATPATVTWVIDAANIGGGTAVSDLDLIDVLPITGDHGSNFAGPGSFVSAEVSAGSGITILYSATPRAEIAHDPADPTNSSTGSTDWCSAPAGGTVVSGDGTAADCPTSPAAVTAIRMLRPGAFTPADDFEVLLRTLADENTAGDVMVNLVQGRASGVATLVAPSEAVVQFNAGPPVAAGSISGTVFDDVAGDGTRDPGDPVLPGQTVTIEWTDAGGVHTLTTTTDVDGLYRFDGLFAGDYTVTFTAPPGQVPTAPGAGSGAPSTAVTLGPVRDAVVDAGFTDPGTLSVTKSVANLTRPGGPTMPGDTLEYTLVVSNSGPGAVADGQIVDDLTGLLDDAGYLSGSADTGSLTRSGGQLLWTGDLAGGANATITYTVLVDAPDTGDKTVANVAFVPATPVTPGTAAPVPDACAAPGCASTSTPVVPGSVSGVVWDDQNGDGVRDAGEPPLVGVTVVVSDSSGTPIATPTTDATGSYSLDGLAAGEYRVTFTPPTGYQTHAGPQSVGATTLLTVDGATPSATASSGMIAAPGTVAGMVWDDRDGDGVHDATEPPMAGVTVTVSGLGGTHTLTTDAAGHYAVTGLAPGDYTVAFTAPAGYTAHAGPDSVGEQATVTVGPTSPTPAVNTGLTALAGTVSGTVWRDADADGVRDAGELPLAGVVVTITDSLGTVVATLTTDAAGHYATADLPVGDYTVAFTPPAGYAVHAGGGSVGGSGTVTLSQLAPSAVVDSGMVVPPGALTGTIWNDVNGNGTRDPGEPGVPGITVTITDPAGTVVATTVTDANGAYTVSGLAPGSYTVTFVAPAGYRAKATSVPVTIVAGQTSVLSASLVKVTATTPTTRPTSTTTTRPTTSSSLAHTGAQPTAEAMLALLLMLVGAALVRRRRRHRPS